MLTDAQRKHLESPTRRSSTSRHLAPRILVHWVAFLVAGLVTGVSAQSGDAPFLFRPLPAGAGAPSIANVSPPGIRQRFAEIDPRALEVMPDDVAGSVVRLNLFPDAEFAAEITDRIPTSAGYALWGHLVGDEMSSVTLVVNGDIVIGSVRTSTGTFSVRSTGESGVVQIQEVDLAALPPGAPPLVPPPTGAPARGDSPLIGSPESRNAVPDRGARVDVLVVYTPVARRTVGNWDHVQAVIDLMVAQTNQAYKTSGVVQRIRIVRTAEVQHRASRDMADDLRQLSGGLLPDVHRLRDDNLADAVVMLVEDSDESQCGIAYQMATPSRRFASFAYGVVRVDCGGLSFAHELGHNMGLNHDRYAERGSLRNAGPHAYSFGYVNQRGLNRGSAARRRWMTIMAYPDQCEDRGVPCRTILRFSNPNQRLHGDRLGVPGTARTPRINGPADARRTLNRTVPIVRNFRRAPGGSAAPDLAVQSVRVSTRTVRAGQPATLFATVRNVGGGVSRRARLRYLRWNPRSEEWRQVATDPVARLRAGARGNESARVTPPRAEGGNWYIACVVDVRGHVNQRNDCSDYMRVWVGRGPGQPKRGMEWGVTDVCNDGAAIRYRFFQLGSGGRPVRQWPAGGRYYIASRYGVKYTSQLSLSSGGRVCYGAATPDGRWYWGIGLDGRQGCSDCCYDAPDVGTKPVSVRLSC